VRRPFLEGNKVVAGFLRLFAVHDAFKGVLDLHEGIVFARPRRANRNVNRVQSGKVAFGKVLRVF